MSIYKSVVGKLWMTIIALVALVLMFLGIFLLDYIDSNFANPNDIKVLFIYTAIIGFLLTTFFAFFLFTKITQPLKELKKAADALTKGGYHARVVIRSSDEIGELGQAFNHMAGEMEETIRDLNHEKELLGSILRSMTDAVVTFNASGEVILTNPRGERLVKDWNGLSWEDSHDESSGVPEPLRTVYEVALREAKEFSSILQVQSEVWAVTVTPLQAQEQIRGVVAVLRNVTEEHRLEKLRRDFVANVSHELRTPLSMMQGYSEALVDEIEGSLEERRELAKIILDESMRMSRLVQNLLDLSRMESGNMQLHCQDVQVPLLVKRMQRKFAGVCREQGVELISELPDTQPELQLICADEDRLEQVFTNLLDNALRHSPAGTTIRMRAWREVLENQNQEDVIFCEIADQGEGIAEEDLPYVFERFYKADKARTRRNSLNAEGGTGLGLSIVKNIIVAHQGRISASSQVGRGTSFLIQLPVVRQEQSK